MSSIGRGRSLGRRRGSRASSGAGHIGELHVEEPEVGVVRDSEHAVRAQCELAVDAQVGRDLRRGATVAQHLDVDRHRTGRHGRDEDRVGSDERELRPPERFLHRPQRRVHRDAAEHVHDLPPVGDIGVKATGDRGVGSEHGVGAQVAGAFGHQVRIGCAHGRSLERFCCANVRWRCSPTSCFEVIEAPVPEPR